MRFFPATSVAGVCCVLAMAGRGVRANTSDEIVSVANPQPGSSHTSPADAPAVATDHFLVQFRAGLPAGGMADVRVGALKERWKIVVIRPGLDVPPKDAALAAELGLDRFFIVDVPIGTDTRAAAAEFASFVDLFEVAEPDPVGTLHSAPTDPGFQQQWSLNNMGQMVGGSPGRTNADIDWLEAWLTPSDGAPIVIAILDTGVSMSHPDLRGQLVPGRCFTCGASVTNTDDDSLLSHGTYCAGIAAAITNNGIGMAGVAPRAKIMPVKVISGQAAFTSWAANGLVWAADNGALIASMSFGFGSSSNVTFLHTAAQYAGLRGVLLVASAGNDVGVPIGAPASFAEVLAVGATDSQDRAFVAQSTGPEMDLAAPGVAVYTTVDQADNIDGYALETGTSMAAPMVAGAAAMVWGAKITLSAGGVRAILEATVDDLGAPGWDPVFGVGRINLNRALSRLVIPPRPCTVDINGDGVVDVGDLFMFLDVYFGSVGATGGVLIGDFDRNGVVSVEDIFAFMNAWFIGC